MRAAGSRTFCTAGRRRPIRVAMIAITTSSSISVKASLLGMVFLGVRRLAWAHLATAGDRGAMSPSATNVLYRAICRDSVAARADRASGSRSRRGSGGGVGGGTEQPLELPLDQLEHPPPEVHEPRYHPPGDGRQRGPLRAAAADLGLHQGAAERRLGLLDPAPDVAVALAQLGGRLLDRAGPLDRLEDLGDAEPEGVVAPLLQPDLYPGDQVGPGGPGAGSCRRHKLTRGSSRGQAFAPIEACRRWRKRCWWSGGVAGHQF